MTGWQSGVSFSFTRKNVSNQNDVIDTEENTGNQGSSVNFVEASHSIPNIEIPDGVTILFDVRNGNGNIKLQKNNSQYPNNIVWRVDVRGDTVCDYIFDPYFGYCCMYGRYVDLRYIMCNLNSSINFASYSKLYVVFGYSLTSDYNENTDVSTSGVFKIKIYPNLVSNSNTGGTELWSTSADNLYSNYCVAEIDVSSINNTQYLYFLMENTPAKVLTEHLDSFSIYAIYGR